MTELKPCPCGCGVHPVIYDYDGTFPRKTKWIKCPVCGWSTDAMTIEHCIEQWNRRAERMSEEEPCCGNCKHSDIIYFDEDDWELWCPKTGTEDIPCEHTPCEYYERESQ